ncbi:hypothetical protein HPB50_022961 [Hyalomma asiaticum]|uniref:Uncharacterized protein n=1 Tax=Hyalomma asiaticum TaxID=266040 RepID=A0ACB7SAW3_HYAAI|nr:hypothetical protein HPB50_022961 [Hyalomma asiaticum]
MCVREMTGLDKSPPRERALMCALREDRHDARTAHYDVCPARDKARLVVFVVVVCAERTQTGARKRTQSEEAERIGRSSAPSCSEGDEQAWLRIERRD